MAVGFARATARTTGIVLAFGVCAALGACGGGQKPAADGPPSGDPSRGACPPAPAVRAASGPAAPRPVVQAAARYLAVRESWLSACRPNATAWEAQGRKLMTPRGWKARPRDKVRVADVRAAMVKNHWNVRVSVSCMENREAGKGRAAWYPLFCSLTDTTVASSGAAVPKAKLPGDWPFAGAQNPVPLAMAARGGTWLVDQDLTGMAQ